MTRGIAVADPGFQKIQVFKKEGGALTWMFLGGHYKS